MRHTGIVTVLLSTTAIVATASVGIAWPVASHSSATDHVVLAQMGGMGGMSGGGMGGGGMGGGGMSGGGMSGGGMGGMGGSAAQRPGGMGGGGMSGGGMGGMGGSAAQRPGGMGGGGMRGDGGMGGGGMRGDGGMGGMGGNNRNRNRNVNVNRNTNVYVRGVRPWSSRPWFGTAVAGVTLGTIIAVTAVPPVPADNLCWYWIDSFENRGYWDWCVPPL